MIQRQHKAQQWGLWITHKPSQGALPFILNFEMAFASVVSSSVSTLLSDSKCCSEWGPGQLRCYCVCRECRVEGNKSLCKPEAWLPVPGSVYSISRHLCRVLPSVKAAAPLLPLCAVKRAWPPTAADSKCSINMICGWY